MDTPKRPKQKRSLLSLLGTGLGGFIRLVRHTSHMKTHPKNIPRDVYESGPFPFIAAMWHGQFMMLPYSVPKGRPISIMLARHTDAELMGGALQSFGFKLVRGAGAGARKRDRGGADALRGAFRALKSGEMVGMTCEIPPGPARRVTRGVITLARLSGKPIRPVAAATSRYLTLNTWSRFTIALPFSGFGLVWGEPIYVPRDATSEDMEKYRALLEDRLNAATHKAYELAGGDMQRSLPANLAKVPPPGVMLKLYRAATKAFIPLAPRLLDRREKRGKELPEHRPERFGIATQPRPAGRLVWVHAASVGETNAVLPVMAELRRRRPGITFLLTTGTVTSAEIARSRLHANDLHQFVPLDAPEFVTRFLDYWRPDLTILTESEIWPNMILEADSRGIPIVVVNGRLSPKSFKSWSRRRRTALALFGRISLAVAQNDRMAHRFLRLGAREAVAVGNVKVDAPAPVVDAGVHLELRSLIGDRPAFLAASTHNGEEQLIAAAHRIVSRHVANALTIIIPRHPERGADVAEELRQAGLNVAQRSKGEVTSDETDIYLADTLGEIGTFYSVAPVAFVGGSLIEHGGQNPIEATKHGAAIITGPHWTNFRDIFKELLRADGAIEVEDENALAEAVVTLLTNAEVRRATVAKAEETVEQMSGALSETVGAILPFLRFDQDVKRAS